MAKLTMAERKRLPKSDFAVPSKAPGPGSYPEPDEEHARVAKGLAGMHHGPKKAVNKLAKKKFSIAIFITLLLFGVSLDAEPVYNATAAPIIQSGQYYTVWSAETPTPGNGTTAASQQVALQSQPGKNGMPFSVDGKFSGAPGAFEIDVQVAAQDADANYQTCSNCAITTVDTVNNTFHLDYSGTTRFMRLLLRVRANTVSITATVTGG